MLGLGICRAANVPGGRTRGLWRSEAAPGVKPADTQPKKSSGTIIRKAATPGNTTSAAGTAAEDKTPSESAVVSASKSADDKAAAGNNAGKAADTAPTLPADASPTAAQKAGATSVTTADDAAKPVATANAQDKAAGATAASDVKAAVSDSADGKPEATQGELKVPEDREVIEAVDPSLIGKPGVIYKGEIPVTSFLTFMANYKGMPVLYDYISSATYFDKKVRIESKTLATYEIVKAILEANSFIVVERQLPDGTSVVEVMNNKRRVVHTEASPLIVEPGDKPLIEGVEPDQEVTMYVSLEYAEAKTVEGVITSILGKATSTTAGGIQVITVERTNTLIFKGKFSLMDYVRKLVNLLDVDLPDEEEEIIEIVDVREAEATELAGLIEEVLSGANQSSMPGSSSSISRTSSISRSRLSSSSRSRTSGSRYGSELETILIPDERTQRIIIVSTNERELELVMYLVDMLDQEITDPRHKTHIYQVKYLTAVDVAAVISELMGGTSRTGLSGRTSGANRTSTTSGTSAANRLTTNRTSSLNRSRTAGDAFVQIVPHEETNSLLIQAEPEEYEEILHILQGIDRKRNQVFLECALVQVSDNSTLNHTIELLAGNLDDRDTRMAAMSSFGLSAVDPSLLPSTFDRLILDAAASPGLTSVISRNGQIPALVKFLKGNNESQVIATPFILADDNEQNEIQILTTTYVLTQQSVGTANMIQEPKGEEAGVTLRITPTISKNAVLLDMYLEVSEFAEAATTTGNLPDKTQNIIQGRVSVPDGELFVIGGLTSESKSESVDKIPILGDIPLLGLLFQSRSKSSRRSKLYVFLTAHVLTDRSFRDSEHLTREASEGVKTFKGGKDIKLQHFTKPPVFKDNARSKDDLNKYEALEPVTPYEKRVK